jgi:competence protein ComEC
MRGLALSALLALVACRQPERTAAPATPAPSLSAGPEATFSLTMMDVGTGLALLVRGEDFALLYDAGSNDDRKTGPDNRALAYLRVLLGPSGPSERCGGDQDSPERPLAHVVLSHPHRDHESLLPDVFACHAVAHFWESGAASGSAGHRALEEALAAEPGLVRRRARPGDTIELGRLARARVLSSRADVRDLNDASVVLRLELGLASVLFMGDAPGGERRAPSSAPERGSVEAELLAGSRRALDADVLVVGHHGSTTSTRTALLDAVTPRYALVSAGPFPYGKVELPDAEVIEALVARGIVVKQTKVDDDVCRRAPVKVGRDADGAPGGCSAVTLRISSTGAIAVEDAPLAD